LSVAAARAAAAAERTAAASWRTGATGDVAASSCRFNLRAREGVQRSRVVGEVCRGFTRDGRESVRGEHAPCRNERGQSAKQAHCWDEGGQSGEQALCWNERGRSAGRRMQSTCATPPGCARLPGSTPACRSAPPPAPGTLRTQHPRHTAVKKLRIVSLGLGTARQKMLLERWTHPKISASYVHM
jgi:hypothetical protein